MTDYSSQYADDHKAYIYFSDDSKTVKLKAFLSALTIGMSVDREETSNYKNDILVYRDQNVTYNYSFSIDIPFYDLNEAKAGKADIDDLEDMFRPQSTIRASSNFAKGIKVLFSNLINNGAGVSSVKLHGVSAIVKSLNIEYNTEMGFFDSSREFYSKNYTISFDLDVLVHKKSRGDLCRGFDREGKYDPDDVKFWPFAVQQERGSNLGPNGYENSYVTTHDAKIKISHFSEARSVRFNAYLENFSRANSYEFGEFKDGIVLYTPKEIKQVSYKFALQVPAGNIAQARHNMAQAQVLLRIFAPRKRTGSVTPASLISFSNLISKQPVYINSVSIKIDTELGFFEKDGRFYAKNYTIDLSAERATKVTSSARRKSGAIRPGAVTPPGSTGTPAEKERKTGWGSKPDL